MIKLKKNLEEDDLCRIEGCYGPAEKLLGTENGMVDVCTEHHMRLIKERDGQAS